MYHHNGTGSLTIRKCISANPCSALTPRHNLCRAKSLPCIETLRMNRQMITILCFQVVARPDTSFYSNLQKFFIMPKMESNAISAINREANAGVIAMNSIKDSIMGNQNRRFHRIIISNF